MNRLATDKKIIRRNFIKTFGYAVIVGSLLSAGPSIGVEWSSEQMDAGRQPADQATLCELLRSVPKHRG